jgi:hypothetical protein
VIQCLARAIETSATGRPPVQGVPPNILGIIISEILMNKEVFSVMKVVIMCRTIICASACEDVFLTDLFVKHLLSSETRKQNTEIHLQLPATDLL